MEKIDRYEIIRLLGEGAMGKVYLAQDPELERTVAIKLLAKDVENPEMRERFRREVRAVAVLKHPNIVELYDYSGEHATQLYFVMEYVPGSSLFDLVHDNGVMPEITALCIGHELTLALMHAHENNIVHRDIKPENILLNQGRLVLTDFGIVKAIVEQNFLGVRLVPKRTRSLGTPGFMAPEQFDGRNIDFRTDIFALGAVLYNLTTGHVPYEGGTVENIYRNLKRGKCVDPRTHLQTLTPKFCNLIAGCIAPNARDRFEDGGVLRDHIRTLLQEAGVADVRDELRTYQANPKTHRQSPIANSSLDQLLDTLKQALRKEDHIAARHVLARLNLPTPPPAKMTWGRRDRRFALGLVIGLALGALVTVLVYLLTGH